MPGLSRELRRRIRFGVERGRCDRSAKGGLLGVAIPRCNACNDWRETPRSKMDLRSIASRNWHLLVAQQHLHYTFRVARMKIMFLYQFVAREFPNCEMAVSQPPFKSQTATEASSSLGGAWGY